LEWLLDIGDSTITYRTRYIAAPLLGSTIDLLVFDKTNPRALAYQWNHMQYSLVRIAASLGGIPDDSIDEAVSRSSKWKSFPSTATARARCAHGRPWPSS
jgi:uncharacterized alpha-E superfamily protein